MLTRAGLQYTNLIPPVSVEVLSYGRFMQLLKARQIKRVQVLGDGTAAIVDVRPSLESPIHALLDRFMQPASQLSSSLSSQGVV